MPGESWSTSRRGYRTTLRALAPLVLAGCGARAPGSAPGALQGPDLPTGATSYVYVANASPDIVSPIASTPGEGARVDKEIPVGLVLSDFDAPHGLAVSPDGAYWSAPLAHGTPFGTVWKSSIDEDTLAGRVRLGHVSVSTGSTPGGVDSWMAW